MELVINDRIRNRKVEKFNSFSINLKLNSVASPFAFDFYFDPDVIEQKEMACIGHFHICKLYDEGELILTGQMTEIGFQHSSVRHMVSIGGYSSPGILENCSIPTDDAINKAIANGNLKIKPGDAIPYCYPLQTSQLSIRQITEKLLKPFNLDFIVDASVSSLMDESIDETTADTKATIKHYLTSLTSQKGIVLSHDAQGRLVFSRPAKNLQPIHFLDVPKNGIPGVTIKCNYRGENMHSQITVMKQADSDNDNAGEFTVNNPYVPFIFRPITLVQNSGTDIDTELAAKNALRDELRNLSWTIDMDRWRVNGKIIRPGTVWSIKDPENYLFHRTNLMVEDVQLKGDQKQQTASVKLVLQCVYDDSDPTYLFKGINLH